MIELLTNNSRHKALKLYEGTAFIFPFIHSVLTNIQYGRVFVDNPNSPKCGFVMHDFGWSQFFGTFDKLFLKSVESFLFTDERFTSFKVRLFCPEDFWCKPFEQHAEISERCRFRLPKQIAVPIDEKFFSIEQISSHNFEKINEQFDLDLFSRNWPSRSAFKNGAFGVVLTVNNEFASICYSCASANSVHEIDIFTNERFRRNGFGKCVGQAFINNCIDNAKLANWDCFTNNSGSMRLARALGFQANGNPYKFFTYNRRKKITG
jgi:RimJ/RimL family protein N-acetyltransferase